MSKVRLANVQNQKRAVDRRNIRKPAVLKRRGFSPEQNDAVISVVMDLVEQINVVLKPFEIELTVS